MELTPPCATGERGCTHCLPTIKVARCPWGDSNSRPLGTNPELCPAELQGHKRLGWASYKRPARHLSKKAIPLHPHFHLLVPQRSTCRPSSFQQMLCLLMQHLLHGRMLSVRIQ